MEMIPGEGERYVFETGENGEKIEAELVTKIDDKLDLYVTGDGEQMLISNDENISGPRAMHRYLGSDAYMAMVGNISSDDEDDEDTDEMDDEEASDEPIDLKEALDGSDSPETVLLSILSEDVMLDNIQRMVSIIENLTDEQVRNLGPDGIEQVFVALSKFYYTYMQTTNPLWEVTQARYAELKKWQKLYMDKYYHK